MHDIFLKTGIGKQFMLVHFVITLYYEGREETERTSLFSEWLVLSNLFWKFLIRQSFSHIFLAFRCVDLYMSLLASISIPINILYPLLCLYSRSQTGENPFKASAGYNVPCTLRQEWITMFCRYFWYLTLIVFHSCET